MNLTRMFGAPYPTEICLCLPLFRTDYVLFKRVYGPYIYHLGGLQLAGYGIWPQYYDSFGH